VKGLGSKAPRVVNIFYGEERYLLDRELARALRWPDRFITALDGEHCSEDGIVSVLGDRPLFDDKGVVVVVDNAESVKLAGTLAAYVDEVAADGSTVLVLICRTARLAKSWVQLGQKGRVVEHPRFKPWEREKIKERMGKEAVLLGLTLADGGFDVLFKVHGEQTDCMVNEIRKAAMLLAKGEQITSELVLSLCARRVAVAPWDVSEAAFAKDEKRALMAISTLYQDKGDESLVPVVMSMIKQLEQMVVMRSLLDRQQSPEAIASALGLHPYRVQRELVAVQKHTTAQLINQMKNLCELEVQVKGAAPSKRTLVELAVLSLAA
jgi:DNA polymerase III delta subunit